MKLKSIQQKLRAALGHAAIQFANFISPETAPNPTAAKPKKQPSAHLKNEKDPAQRQAPKTSDIQTLEEQTIQFVKQHYDVRYNLLNSRTEVKRKDTADSPFAPYTRFVRNSVVLALHKEGHLVWNADVDRVMESDLLELHHPISHYLRSLPHWDGCDRVTELAHRVSADELWTHVFHLWMRSMVAVWHTAAYSDDPTYASSFGSSLPPLQRCNSLIPLLVGEEQGLRKSTFCRLLLPPQLRDYYTDKFELTGTEKLELPLSHYGLINLDEFDRYSLQHMAKLKNLVQLGSMSARKAYSSSFTALSRLASFIGTSNRYDLLTDPTGSRRFFCQEVTQIIDCTTPLDHAQIYAQLLHEVLEGERTYLTHEEERAVQQHNRTFYRQSSVREAFLLHFAAGDAATPIAPAAADIVENKKDVWLTATSIYQALRKSEKSAIRTATPATLGRELTLLSLPKRRTSRGTIYCVRMKR